MFAHPEMLMLLSLVVMLNQARAYTESLCFTVEIVVVWPQKFREGWQRSMGIRGRGL